MPIYPSPAVERAGHVLWYLAEHPAGTHSVAKLSRELGIPRATCDSILQALNAQGFVNRRDQDGSYQLGPACLAVASAAQAANTELNLATRHAEQLARDIGACVAVISVIADEPRVVAVFDRAPATILRARVGQTIPWTSPFGATFVAWHAAAAEMWLQRTAGTTDPQHLRESLRFTRRHGYSFSTYSPADQPSPSADLPDGARLATDLIGDVEIQLAHLSAPVFDANGVVTASIAVLGTQRPLLGDDVQSLASRVVESADRATTLARDLRLGGPAVAL